MRRSTVAALVFSVFFAALPFTLWCQLAHAPASPLSGCAADPQSPSFEVAAVTPVAEKDRGATEIGQYGLPSFRMHGVSLRLLLSFSFNIQPENFTNAPHGLDDAVFDVDVKSEDGLLLSYDLLRPRLQQLLKQRFCLKANVGTKEVMGYVLSVGKDGTKLKPVTSTGGQGSGYITQHEVNGTYVDMNSFAGMLASPAGKPVKDATGLPGRYTLKVEFASVTDEASSLPSIFTAVKEQLGLELKPGRVPVPTLTIEHLNLVPSDN